MAENSQGKSSSKGSAGAIAGGLTILAVLAAKSKGLLFGFLSLLKAGWLLKSFTTMFVSFGLYAMLYGWQFAVTLIALLYVHEMGHFVYMKKMGFKPEAPVFVPFIGAYVAMKNLPEDKATHAWVAYAGPFAGAMAALACWELGLMTGNNFLLAAANFGFVLNLLQLVPVRPFDGGFIAECISKWLIIPGMVALIILAIMLKSILLIIVGAVGFFRMVALFKGGGAVSTSREATAGERVGVTLAYIALAAILGYYYFLSGEVLSQIHKQV